MNGKKSWNSMEFVCPYQQRALFPLNSWLYVCFFFRLKWWHNSIELRTWLKISERSRSYVIAFGSAKVARDQVLLFNNGQNQCTRKQDSFYLSTGNRGVLSQSARKKKRCWTSPKINICSLVLSAQFVFICKTSFSAAKHSTTGEWQQ